VAGERAPGVAQQRDEQLLEPPAHRLGEVGPEGGGEIHAQGRAPHLAVAEQPQAAHDAPLQRREVGHPAHGGRARLQGERGHLVRISLPWRVMRRM
jgi:hypothetical protein